MKKAWLADGETLLHPFPTIVEEFDADLATAVADDHLEEAAATFGGNRFPRGQNLAMKNLLDTIAQ